MKTMGRGIWSGLMATGSMTSLMFELFQELPAEEKSPLAPATITGELIDKVVPVEKFSPNQREHLSLISHFGYGAAFGLLYSLLVRNSSVTNKASLVRGNAFGLALWTASYKGWLPLMGLRAQAARTPWKRNLMMIGSHLLWGSLVGLSDQKLRKTGKKMLDGTRQAPAAE